MFLEPLQQQHSVFVFSELFTQRSENNYFSAENYVTTSDLMEYISGRQPTVQHDQAVHGPALANTLD